MFNKILIANRGEIACRIIKTAHRLGIQCVAVYSQADEKAQHVTQADEAYCIGAPPASESYLDIKKIIAVAKQTGAQAIHPGYGFLSENCDFANACAKEGITFIGPPANAIDEMGSKSKAKDIMEKADVPIIQGYQGKKQDAEFLQEQANKIGYPVLIKAAAGGGGKGMRAVESKEQFADALAAAKREAKNSFGDDIVLLEKLLKEPRHIEIQIFADTHGNCVYLFERDCSIQRRHQKIIEEAPAPGVSQELREQMGEAGIKAAKAIGYVGAGTIEFLLDQNQNFYFMEMNTRLQVEHPITEMITKLDLVEWQLRVAFGEKLPKTQDEIKLHGHAFEVRLYAEDPNNQFLPATGHLAHLKYPQENENTRVDTGITQGDDISIYYDPMLAKIITWDEDRDTARERMHSALCQLHVVGLTTNRDFLLTIIQNSDFAKAKINTNFIEQHHDDLFSSPEKLSKEAIALALSHIINDQNQTSLAQNHYSPWNSRDSWRLNLPHKQYSDLNHDGDVHSFSIEFNQDNYKVEATTMNSAFDFSFQTQLANEMEIRLDNNTFHGSIYDWDNSLYIFYKDHNFKLSPITIENSDEESLDEQNAIFASMPAKIIAINVKVGDQVKKDQPLIILEAMKMEQALNANNTATVTAINFAVGEQVTEGSELIKLEPIENND